jgi:hypothetical protein
VYPAGASRGTPLVLAGAYFPAISPTQSLPPGDYQIDAYPDPHLASAVPTMNESVHLSAGERLTVVLQGHSFEGCGTFAISPLQFLNFIEPTLPPGQTALVFHDSSNITPLAAQTGPTTSGSITRLFTLTQQTTSGPASPGTAAGGEYFFAQSSIASNIHVVIGPAGSTPLSPYGDSSAYFNTGIPPGTHVSLFAIDLWTPDCMGLLGVDRVADP